MLATVLFVARTYLGSRYRAIADYFSLWKARHARDEVWRDFRPKFAKAEKEANETELAQLHDDFHDKMQEISADVTQILCGTAHRLGLQLPPKDAWEENAYGGLGSFSHKVSLTPKGEEDLLGRIRAEKRERRAERARIWTVLIALATVGYAVLSFLQWRSLDESTRRANQYFEVGQRAYITVKNLSLGGIGGDDASFVALCENTGKTPAINITAKYGLYVDHSTPQSGYPTIPFNSTMHNQVLPPGGVLRISKTEKITGQEFALIEDKKEWLYFAGTLEYQDVFGGHHKTDFCALYTPNTGFSPETRTVGIMSALCADHNSVD